MSQVDPEALKKRLRTFIALDTLAVLVTAAGFIGDFAFGNPAFRPVWILGIVGVVAVMTWLVLGMRAGKES
jgi:hypothetical protein